MTRLFELFEQSDYKKLEVRITIYSDDTVENQKLLDQQDVATFQKIIGKFGHLIKTVLRTDKEQVQFTFLPNTDIDAYDIENALSKKVPKGFSLIVPEFDKSAF